MPPVWLSSLQLQTAVQSCAQTLQLLSPTQVYTWTLLLIDRESLVTLPGTYMPQLVFCTMDLAPSPFREWGQVCNLTETFQQMSSLFQFPPQPRWK